MNMEHLIAFFRDLTATFPAWLLWFGACVGHGFLTTTGLNVLYAWPLPHSVLKCTRKLDILLIGSGPLLFWYTMDLSGSRVLNGEAGSLRTILAPYLVMCWGAGFLLAPVAQ